MHLITVTSAYKDSNSIQQAKSNKVGVLSTMEESPKESSP